MERSTILRWVIIAAVVALGWYYFPKFFGGGGGKSTQQPLGAESACDPRAPCLPPERAPETTCELTGVRFKAQFSSQGAALKHFWLEDQRYHQDDGKPIDVVTTPDQASRRSLRFDWRGPIGAEKDVQVPYDILDWKLEAQDGKRCVFKYTSDQVELQKVIQPTDKPFELLVEASVKNLAQEKKRHQLAVEAVAWRLAKEVESSLGRQSPFLTNVECFSSGKMQRMTPAEFEPDDFSDAGYENGWFVQRNNVSFAAVSNFYFAQALVPMDPPASSCKLQVEERWHSDVHPDKTKDPNFGAMYRVRIGYETKELGPAESTSYKVLAYMGPKERDVLGTAAGGNHHLSELVDLGYFSIIAKLLLQFLVLLHSWVGNWGIAIILMTISVRTLLFPLTWKSIQSGLAMRRLKPELDEINRKYGSDPQQKNVATMELWKKHKVNPLGGCLPALFQLPVWWALYTSLQTAVELYRTPFVWFRDLSAADPYYILPIVLGGTMILQQRLMPMQLDPVQQKMMTYVMPAVFTFMMLFLPAGLAVYMLTNAIIGILQQLAIEWHWKRGAPVAAGITVSEKVTLGKSSSGGNKGDGPVQKRY